MQPGYFLIVDLSADKTGKSVTLAKLAMTFNSKGKISTPSATYTVEGATINEIQEEKEKSYSATVGHFFVRTGQLDLMKQLVPRLLSTASPAHSLGESAAYQQSRKQMGGGNLVEVFLRVPDLKDIQLPATAKIDATAFTRALHTDSIKVACGSVNVSGEAARMQFAVLGDTTHGGLFDFVGTRSRQPLSSSSAWPSPQSEPGVRRPASWQSFFHQLRRRYRPRRAGTTG